MVFAYYFGLATVLLVLLTLSNQVTSDPVHIWSTESNQPITSTTLQWKSTNGKNSNILKNAVVAAFQTIDNDDPESINEDSLDNNNVQKASYPVYICRAKVTSIWVTGQLRPQNNVCVVSLYRKVQEYEEFEVLINIDNSARLTWLQKNKYIILPNGAVTSGENVLRTFVARRQTETHNRFGSLTHFIGTFNPSENLGVYNLVDQNNNEISYEDGEILVETEPISYEFKSLKFKKGSSKRFPRTQTVLATTVLKNNEKGLQKVESVMDYKYKYFISWGKGHGMLTGLPFTVPLPTGNKIVDHWGLAEPITKVETVPIERYLEEGTGVNITLMGNFTEMEIPYTATVVASYKDGEQREFVIEDTKREHKVIELVFNYSPVFFIHNNSFVPTTTTTTTTSTTSTSSTTRTTTKLTVTTPREFNHHPEVIITGSEEKLDNSMAADDSLSSSILQDPSTQREASSLEKKVDTKSTATGGTVGIKPIFCRFFYISSVLLSIFIRVI